jgi:hypothetical protein
VPSTLWDRWLVAAILAVLAYSGLLVVGGGIAGEVFARLGFGMTDAGIESRSARGYVLLVYGVLGAVMIGWCLLLLAVVAGPLRRREPWAWRAVAGSLTCWFLVDTSLSLAVGFPTHALFNTVFAVAVAVPLAGLRGRTPLDQRWSP